MAADTALFDLNELPSLPGMGSFGNFAKAKLKAKKTSTATATAPPVEGTDAKESVPVQEAEVADADGPGNALRAIADAPDAHAPTQPQDDPVQLASLKLKKAESKQKWGPNLVIVANVITSCGQCDKVKGCFADANCQLLQDGARHEQEQSDDRL